LHEDIFFVDRETGSFGGNEVPSMIHRKLISEQFCS